MRTDVSDEEAINVASIGRKNIQPCRTSVSTSVTDVPPRAFSSGAPCGPLLPATAAEATGTALLVLAACLVAGQPPLTRALAAGTTVAMLVQCLDHLSGAMMNPSVALAAAVVRRISWRRCAVYLGAQLLGAAAAALLMLGAARPEDCAACATAPGAGLSAPRAALLEAAFTALLAAANCAAWDARNAGLRDSWPLRIGVTVTALSLLGGELTGASMNPARSLAPLLCGAGGAPWPYVAGAAGAVGAAALYRTLWLHRVDGGGGTV